MDVTNGCLSECHQERGRWGERETRIRYGPEEGQWAIQKNGQCKSKDLNDVKKQSII